MEDLESAQILGRHLAWSTGESCQFKKGRACTFDRLEKPALDKFSCTGACAAISRDRMHDLDCDTAASAEHRKNISGRTCGRAICRTWICKLLIAQEPCGPLLTPTPHWPEHREADGAHCGCPQIRVGSKANTAPETSRLRSVCPSGKVWRCRRRCRGVRISCQRRRKF